MEAFLERNSIRGFNKILSYTCFLFQGGIEHVCVLEWLTRLCLQFYTTELLFYVHPCDHKCHVGFVVIAWIHTKRVHLIPPVFLQQSVVKFIEYIAQTTQPNTKYYCHLCDL